MELAGDHATDWYNFTVELSRAGITLNEDKRTNLYGLEATRLEGLLSKIVIMLSYLHRLYRLGAVGR
jgi:hypothetical protein